MLTFFTTDSDYYLSDFCVIFIISYISVTPQNIKIIIMYVTYAYNSVNCYNTINIIIYIYTIHLYRLYRLQVYRIILNIIICVKRKFVTAAKESVFLYVLCRYIMVHECEDKQQNKHDIII